VGLKTFQLDKLFPFFSRVHRSSQVFACCPARIVAQIAEVLNAHDVPQYAQLVKRFEVYMC
jgi:hypothetical protein